MENHSSGKALIKSQRGGWWHYRQLPLVLFGLGATMAVVAWRIPGLHRVFLDLSAAGYAGVLVAGVMYGSSFTSSAATIILTHLPTSMNVLLVGIVGAVGAMAYDLSVFVLVRRMSHLRFFGAAVERWRHRHWPRWLAVIAGGLIIASPLPDELAASLLSFSSISRRRFAVISFIGNMVGIQVITGLF